MPNSTTSSSRPSSKFLDAGDRIFTVSTTCQVLELECLYYTYDGKIRNPIGGKMWDGVCINCMLDLLKRMPDITPRYCRPVCINEG